MNDEDEWLNNSVLDDEEIDMETEQTLLEESDDESHDDSEVLEIRHSPSFVDLDDTASVSGDNQYVKHEKSPVEKSPIRSPVLRRPDHNQMKRYIRPGRQIATNNNNNKYRTNKPYHHKKDFRCNNTEKKSDNFNNPARLRSNTYGHQNNGYRKPPKNNHGLQNNQPRFINPWLNGVVPGTDMNRQNNIPESSFISRQIINGTNRNISSIDMPFTHNLQRTLNNSLPTLEIHVPNIPNNQNLTCQRSMSNNGQFYSGNSSISISQTPTSFNITIPSEMVNNNHVQNGVHTDVHDLRTTLTNRRNGIHNSIHNSVQVGVHKNLHPSNITVIKNLSNNNSFDRIILDSKYVPENERVVFRNDSKSIVIVANNR